MAGEANGLEPIESSAIIVIILYALIILQIAWLLMSLHQKWRHRRVQTVRRLLYAFISYMLTFVFLLLGILEGYITGYKQTIYRICMGLGYFFLMFAHVLFLNFAKEVYGFEQKYLWKYEIAGVFVAILVALPQNYYGIPTGQEGPDNIRLYSSIAMLLYSLLIFTLITIKTASAYQRVKLRYARYGFLGFLIAQIAMICVFLFVLVDFVYWEALMKSGYTIFYYFAILSGMVSIAGFYLAIVIPPVLQRKRISDIARVDLQSGENDETQLKSPHRDGSKERARIKSRSGEHIMNIQCPECGKHISYEIPTELLSARAENPKDVVSIAIPADIICDHPFVIYVDKEFEIRSASPIDHAPGMD